VIVSGRVVALDTPANLAADHKDLEEAYFELVETAWES
jgi:hypothetical protein